MPNIQSMTVLYDSDCDFCIRCKCWLASQHQRIGMQFIPIKSEKAAGLLYKLKGDNLNELIVITDKDEVYYKEKALLMCLYALSEYYEWAFNFSQPLFYPLIRNAYVMLSANRNWLSSIFANHSEEQQLKELQQYKAPVVCQLPKDCSKA